MDVLYITQTGEDSQTWNRIIEMILKFKDEDWKIIDSSYSINLTDNHLRLCDIKKSTKDAVKELLNSLQQDEIKTINFNNLSETDYREILINFGDDNLLKRLPIHKRLKGELVSIDDNCYLQSNFTLEGDLEHQWHELLNEAVLIERADEGMVFTKQKELIPELDASAAIKLSLQMPEPHRYAAVIMEGLSKIGTPSKDLRVLAIMTKWLPVKNNPPIAPESIIHIDSAEEEIDRLLSQNTHGYSSILALKDWIIKHKGFDSLKSQLFPKPKDALDLLSIVLKEKEDFRIGIKSIQSVDDFVYFKNVFLDAPEELMPCTKLLSKLLQDSEVATKSFEILLPFLYGYINADNYRKILDYLSNKHKQNNKNDEKKRIKQWHIEYLKASIDNNCFENILPKIIFLNQEGEWCSSGQVTMPSEGIQRKYLLDKEQWNSISEFIENREKRLIEELKLEDSPNNVHYSKGSKDVLESYFLQFLKKVPSEMVGAVIALLGDAPEIKAWAERLLGKHNIETIRRKMFLKSITEEDNDKYMKEVSKMQFIIDIKEGDQFSVKSIAGKNFQVEITDNIESIIFGIPKEMWWSVGNNCYLRKISFLKSKQICEFSKVDIEGFLQKTAELIAFNVYLNRVESRSPDYTDLWNELRKTAQRDITYAQVILLKNAGEFHIRNLGGDRFPKLKHNLDNWRKANKFETERTNESSADTKTNLQKKIDSIREEAHEELKKLLTEDEDIHAFLVDAVSKRLQDYEYNISSIPFEIFQNADDAYQESERIGLINPEVSIFVMDLQDNILNFIHWGRPINKYYGNTSSDIGRELGFDSDLEKMLMLSFSDKNKDDQSQSVTGKFGFGFKCVYFASMSPKVISERIHFQIRGGFYPEALNYEEAELLNGIISRFKRGNLESGTLIQLPLKDGIQSDDIITIFNDSITILLAFSKKIKTCILSIDGNVREIGWSEHPLNSINCWFIGNITNEKKYLVFKPQSGSNKVKQCAILFELSTRGITRISEDIPSVWITAPTKEKADVGFVINGPFDTSVGRSQLAKDSDNNRSIASELSYCFGYALMELFNAIQNKWEPIRVDMRLSPDCTRDDFWRSFWDIVSSDRMISIKDNQYAKESLLSSICWGKEDYGFERLSNSCAVIPSGFRNAYNELLSTNEIKYCTEGILEDPEILDHFSNLAEFTDKHKEGKIVSKKTYTKIEKLFKRQVDIIFINLDSSLKNIFADNKVETDFANKIGKFINKKFTDRYEDRYHSEIKKIIEYLSSLKFKSKNSQYVSAQKLLVKHTHTPKLIDKDEILRSAFAPEESIISDEYNDSGVEFFILCREKMNAPAEILAQWASNAQERNKLSEVFIYLLEGELNHQIANILDKKWFEKVKESENYKTLTDNEQRDIKWILRAHDDQEQIQPHVNEKKCSSDAIEKIYNWWIKDKDIHIRDYEKKTYPYGQLISFSEKDMENIEADIKTRKKWLILFMLGSFHTMGRQTGNQHRCFIELCDNNKWLDILATPNVSSQELVSIFDKYLDMQNDRSIYYYWMKQFISFYQFSKWLETYVYSINEINKIDEGFDIYNIFNIRTDPYMTGTGLDAPLLDKALGIGMCFIIRELIRCGFIKNSFAYKHAFVPHKRVGDIFEKLGLIMTDNSIKQSHSKEISFFLQDRLDNNRYHFEKSFDIPFFILTENPDKLRELTEIEIDPSQNEPDNDFLD